MISMHRLSLLGVALCLATGCETSSPPAPSAAPPEPPKPAPAPATAVVAPAPVAIDLESLPAEEDFEGEAAKQITSANLEAKLNELEKEVQSD